MSGDLVEALFIYLKIYFQIDLIAYERIMARIRTNVPAYRSLYQQVGEVLRSVVVMDG